MADLYQHCVRAIGHGLRFGAHGLPLMGSGDWNDGMSRVGIDGKGESVWLAFFLYTVLGEFAGLARARGDAAFAALCEAEGGRLRGNIEAHGWDGGEGGGEWYRAPISTMARRWAQGAMPNAASTWWHRAGRCSPAPPTAAAPGWR